MAIQSTDLFFLASERMTQNEDGGGRITARAILDGQENGIFPDIASGDRIAGRTWISKVFAAVRSPDTDTYLASRVFLTNPPEDANVDVLIFSTGSWVDTRSQIVNFIESYTSYGILAPIKLLGEHIPGQAVIQAFATGADAIRTGQTLAITVESSGTVTKSDFFRVTHYTTETVAFTDDKGDFNLIIYTIAIAPPLTKYFTGGVPTRLSTYVPPTLIRKTLTTNLTKFKGISKLIEPATAGDTLLKTDGIYSQIVPTARTESLVLNKAPGAKSSSLSFDTRSVDVNWGNSHFLKIAITAQNKGRNFTFTCDPLPSKSTLTIDYISIDEWYTARDASGLGELSDGGVGTINYTTGTVNATLGLVPDVGTSVLVTWSADDKIQKIEPVTLAVPRSLTFKIPSQTNFDLDISGEFTRGGAPCTFSNGGGGAVLQAPGIDGTISLNGAVVMSFDQPPDVDTPIIITAKERPKSSTMVTVTETVSPTDLVISPTDNISFSVKFPDNTPPLTKQIAVSFCVNYDLKEYGSATTTVKLLINNQNQIVSHEESTTATTLVLDGYGKYFHPQSNAVQWTGSPKLTISLDRGHGCFAGDTYLNEAGNGFISDHIDGDVIDVDKVQMQYIVEVPPAACAEKVTTVTSFKHTLDLSVFTEWPLVPGSIKFEYNGAIYIDELGVIKKQSGVTYVTAGLINYNSRIVTLNTGLKPSNDVEFISAGCGYIIIPDSGPIGALELTYSVPVSNFLFRTSGAPVREGSFKMRIGYPWGSVASVVADSSGAFIVTPPTEADAVDGQDGRVYVIPPSGETHDLTLDGTINYTTGVVSFEASQVMKDSSVRYDCSIMVTLPIDAEYLGITSARLPADGKVPHFVAGDSVILHHTAAVELPNPVGGGQSYPLGRTILARVWVKDADGKPVTGGIGGVYTADLDEGTLTIETGADLSSYTQPLTAYNMIANEGIAVVVNHDGVIQIAPPIIQDFDTDAYLSSCLRIGDVSARVSHLFSQQSWTNTWSDERLGASITAQFNHTIYPIVVTNDGAVTERWRLLFTNATTVDIIAEDLGAIATGLTIVEDIAPINPITNKPFFTIPHLGWGAKWVTGNILRFNTAGADYPIDILRCVSHGPAGVDADRIGLEFLGDIDA